MPVARDLGVRPVRQPAQPDGRDVADREADQRRGEGVGEPGREVPHHRADLQDRDDAEQVPRYDVDRAAHGQVGADAVLDQVDRLLARGVAEADDEDRATAPALAVAVLARVEQVTGVGLHARPGGTQGSARRAGGHHDVAGPPLPIRGGRDPPAVGPGQPGDLGPVVRLDPVVGAVSLEVLDDLVARRVARPGRRHRQAGQGRRRPGRVQVQAVVVPAPRGADHVGRLEHLERTAGGGERGSGGETRGGRSYDEGLGVDTHGPRLEAHHRDVRRFR